LEHNIKKNLKEIGYEDVDRIHLPRDRSCCEHGNEHSDSWR